MGDDFQDICHVTSRFDDVALEGSELEIELSVEFSRDPADTVFRGLPDPGYEDVFWCFYKAQLRSSDGYVDVGVEFGRTLYDSRGKMPHRWDPDGDEKVVSALSSFLAYLSENGARGMIVSDGSTLFDDLGTLEGKDFPEAIQFIVGATAYLNMLRPDDQHYAGHPVEN